MSHRPYQLKPPVGGLMVLTDGRLPFSRLQRVVSEILDAGVKLIQYRPIDLPLRAMLDESAQLLSLVRRYPGARLIINDRVDLALGVGADGVHLGQSDMPIGTARRIAGVDLLIGATVRNAADGVAARDAGADYLGCGPIFVTRSKNLTAPPMGVEGLQKVVEVTDLPTIAISGINEENVASLKPGRPAGVAVLGAVMQSENPAATALGICRVMADWDPSENIFG